MKVTSILSATALGLALSFSAVNAHAQTAAPPPSTPDEPDAVMLKHGGVIKGKVTEILPGDHVTVAMTGGQNAIVRWDEVGSIARGGQLMKMPDAQPTPAPTPTTTTTPAPVPPAYKGPERMPYSDDDDIPKGYHVEKRARLGLIITGAILTGIGAIGIVAFDVQDHVTGSERVAFDVVWGSLFMGPGLPLLIVGLATSNKSLVRDDLGTAKLVKPKAPPFFFSVDPHKEHPGVKLGFTF
ncbi:MAG TPA: hypothetical protein VF407_09625 [Polyangiaceae bacterium]